MSKDRKQAALDYHAQPGPGKIAISITKPCLTQEDLSLAYTPGVAEPVRAIAADPEAAYRYTSKGNLVAVITDGSAVLGLGKVGALAGKPVMEGKGVLFKKFADIDVFDIEVNANSPEHFIETVAAIAPTFGGINLEDIAAPLHHRRGPDRAPRHSGVSRRPARHRHHRRRRPAECARAARQKSRDRHYRLPRRGRRGHRLDAPAGRARREERTHIADRSHGRDPQRSRGLERLQTRVRARHTQARPRRRHAPRRRLHRPVGPQPRERGHARDDGAETCHLRAVQSRS